MKITNLKDSTQGDRRTISVDIGGFDLFFNMPTNFGRVDNADPFVAAALLPAMYKGEDIHLALDLPISQRLLSNLKQLQDIYVQWWPELSVINIDVEQTTVLQLKNSETASFFSGGVDSLYSFYAHQDDIDYLLYVEGIDIQLDNTTLSTQVHQANQAFADKHATPLIYVQSNIRYLPHHFGLSWKKYYCGAGLGVTAMLLGIGTVLIPGSQPIIDVYPDGTTPVTDPLYGNGATKVYYDSALVRHEKIAYLAKHPDAIELLRVCWMDNGYNCGVCEKCVRTRLIFTLLDITSPTLTPCRR